MAVKCGQDFKITGSYDHSNNTGIGAPEDELVFTAGCKEFNCTFYNHTGPALFDFNKKEKRLDLNSGGGENFHITIKVPQYVEQVKFKNASGESVKIAVVDQNQTIDLSGTKWYYNEVSLGYNTIIFYKGGSNVDLDNAYDFNLFNTSSSTSLYTFQDYHLIGRDYRVGGKTIGALGVIPTTSTTLKNNEFNVKGYDIEKFNFLTTQIELASFNLYWSEQACKDFINEQSDKDKYVYFYRSIQYNNVSIDGSQPGDRGIQNRQLELNFHNSVVYGNTQFYNGKSFQSISQLDSNGNINYTSPIQKSGISTHNQSEKNTEIILSNIILPSANLLITTSTANGTNNNRAYLTVRNVSSSSPYTEYCYLNNEFEETYHPYYEPQSGTTPWTTREDSKGKIFLASTENRTTVYFYNCILNIPVNTLKITNEHSGSPMEDYNVIIRNVGSIIQYLYSFTPLSENNSKDDRYWHQQNQLVNDNVGGSTKMGRASGSNKYVYTGYWSENKNYLTFIECNPSTTAYIIGKAKKI